MNTQEAIDQMKSKLAELEAQLAREQEAEKRKVWKPKQGEQYWRVFPNGRVCSDRFDYGSAVCNFNLAIGNCFRTQEEAEFHREKMLVLGELQRYADEHNEGEIDWGDDEQMKYCIYYGHYSKVIFISRECSAQQVGQIYFTSEQIARDAIATVGEERIKKYLFGVM